MHYVGSKNRLAKDIIPIIQSFITPATRGYIEPFVGGANVLDKIAHHNRIGCDLHHYLIAVLNAFADGWVPPKSITEDEYAEIKKSPESYPDYLVGYAGFQLSFGGRWFGVYRRDKLGKRNYAEEAHRESLKQLPLLKGCKFYECDFRKINPEELSGYVIYCDPPYKDTFSYSVNFPYEEFYAWVRSASKNNVVLVSEYNMPEDFTCIWSKERSVFLNNDAIREDRKPTVEKLYRYIPQ